MACENGLILSNITPKSVRLSDVPKNNEGAQSSKIIIMVTIILFLEFFRIHDNAIDINDIEIERTVPNKPTYRIAGIAKLVPFERTIRYGIETKYNIIQMVNVDSIF